MFLMLLKLLFQVFVASGLYRQSVRPTHVIMVAQLVLKSVIDHTDYCCQLDGGVCVYLCFCKSDHTVRDVRHRGARCAWWVTDCCYHHIWHAETVISSEICFEITYANSFISLLLPRLIHLCLSYVICDMHVCI